MEKSPSLPASSFHPPRRPLFLLFAFVLPFLAPWALLAIAGMKEAGHTLSMDGLVNVLALLLLVLIALAIPARIIFEAT